MKLLIILLALTQTGCSDASRGRIRWFLATHEVSIIGSIEHGASRGAVELKFKPSGKQTVRAMK